MADDPQDLYELLSEPVLPDEEPSHVGRLLGALGLIVIVVAAVLLMRREGPAPTSVGAVAGSTSPEPGDADIGSSSDGPTSTTLPPFRYPEPRIDGSMVWDPESDSILLVGGRQEWRSDPMASVWLRDSRGTWAPVEATLEPPAREMAPMVYAGSIGRLVLVGGSPDPTMGCALNTFILPTFDIWTFDPSSRSWEPVHTGGGPAERWGHSLSYDPKSERIILFGGVGTEFDGNVANLLGDTWLLDPAAGEWEALDVADGPSPRACHGMAHDPEGRSTFLWGGRTGLGTSDATLWRFDWASLGWEEVQTTGGPDGRWVAQVVREPTTGLIFVIGGFGPQREETDSGSITSLKSSDEVWALDPQTTRWEQKAPLPFPMSAHAVAADGDGGIVLFIGTNTFEYDTDADFWTDVTPHELLDLEG